MGEQRTTDGEHAHAAIDLLHRTAAAKVAEAPGVAAWAALGSKIFLNLREAAEYAGLPLATIRRLIAREDLPAVRLGGGWRIKRKYLELLDLRHLRKIESRSGPRQR